MDTSSDFHLKSEAAMGDPVEVRVYHPLEDTKTSLKKTSEPLQPSPDSYLGEELEASKPMTKTQVKQIQAVVQKSLSIKKNTEMKRQHLAEDLFIAKKEPEKHIDTFTQTKHQSKPKHHLHESKKAHKKRHHHQSEEEKEREQEQLDTLFLTIEEELVTENRLEKLQ